MGTRQTIAISRRRRGFGRAVVLLGAIVLVVAASGCGRSGHGAATDSEKAADVEVLNTLLGQELTTIAAYPLSLAALQGQMRGVAREFQGQDQAHLDAITKAIRGVGGETEAEASEIETPKPRTQDDALLLLYEMENLALGQALDAAPHLQTSAPRALAAALAANHAQHLTILRQGLGVGLAASVPHAFESGDEPPPVAPADKPATSQ